MNVTNSWAELRSKAEELEAPFTAYLELTSACPWSCLFCAAPSTSEAAALGATEWVEVLDELRELGTLNLVLTGGEPFSSPDFREIALAARARRFVIRVFSNLSLVDERNADLLEQIRPLVVEASLHGAKAATHDAATRHPGSFDDVWRGVERLQRRRIRVILKALVTRLNEAELDDMIALANQQQIGLRLDVALAPRGVDGRSMNGLEASEATQRKVLAEIESRGRLVAARDTPTARGCGAGRSTLAIDPTGEVFPCVQWKNRPLGNVKRQRLGEIWRQSPNRLTVVQIADQANRIIAAAGIGRVALPYCAAIAEQMTGDALVPDPGYMLRRRLSLELGGGS